MASKGKAFEQVFRKDWANTVPDSMCYRLMDVMAGYAQVSNVGDFINYKYPDLFVIDCKSHAGNTVSFSDFSQYDKMLEYKGITGVHLGTVIWLYERDTVVWVPIETWEKIKLDGKKSFNIKMVDDPEYECLVIPSKKLRTYMQSDYSALIDYYKEKPSGND